MPKDVDPADLMAAIRLLAAGESLVSDDLTGDLLRAGGAGPLPGAPPAASGVGLDALTPRQYEVLPLLVRSGSSA